MPLLIQVSADPYRPKREAPYVVQTVRQLKTRLTAHSLLLLPLNAAELSESMINEIRATYSVSNQAPLVVAKAIQRGRKQHYTARLYPLATQLGPGMRRHNLSVRKLATVNAAVVIRKGQGRVRAKVIPADGTEMLGEGEHIVVRRGMFCRAVRAGKAVSGLVEAIHSTGRIALHTLRDVQPDRVRWQRVVVSPKQTLQILSSDGVVFLRSEEKRM